MGRISTIHSIACRVVFSQSFRHFKFQCLERISRVQFWLGSAQPVCDAVSVFLQLPYVFPVLLQSCLQSHHTFCLLCPAAQLSLVPPHLLSSLSCCTAVFSPTTPSVFSVLLHSCLQSHHIYLLCPTAQLSLVPSHLLYSLSCCMYNCLQSHPIYIYTLPTCDYPQRTSLPSVERKFNFKKKILSFL